MLGSIFLRGSSVEWSLLQEIPASLLATLFFNLDEHMLLPLCLQLAEAQQLAQYSAGEMAALVQQLAEAAAERGEAAARLAESRDEVARLRAGAQRRQAFFYLIESF